MRDPGSARSFTRPPSAAGSFYPSDPDELRRVVDRLLADEAPGTPEAHGSAETPLVLISPHAGYRYSGSTAAAGFARVARRRFSTIVILSPSHREYFDGISVFDGDSYATPLGTSQVDEDLRRSIAGASGFVTASRRGHGEEHAVEVQLPFIQRLWPEASILPIVMGDQRPDYCRRLGESLARLIRPGDQFVVASTDLSHYHPYGEADRLDRRFAELVAGLKTEELLEALCSGEVEACGGGPTAVALIAASLLGADASSVVGRCNSGDVTGNRSSVVGYLSAITTRKS